MRAAYRNDTYRNRAHTYCGCLTCIRRRKRLYSEDRQPKWELKRVNSENGWGLRTKGYHWWSEKKRLPAGVRNYRMGSERYYFNGRKTLW